MSYNTDHNQLISRIEYLEENRRIIQDALETALSLGDFQGNINNRHSPSRILQEAEKRIRDLLTKIELEPDKYINRLTTELSGGEKQRICIARALAAEPDLIICDEVTSALDQLVAEGILTLLQDLQNEMNISYLFITHDLATVKAISDKIVIMLEGRIIEQGEKKEILEPP